MHRISPGELALVADEHALAWLLLYDATVGAVSLRAFSDVILMDQVVI
jgi:hypothetical protein